MYFFTRVIIYMLKSFTRFALVRYLVAIIACAENLTSHSLVTHSRHFCSAPRTSVTANSKRRWCNLPQLKAGCRGIRRRCAVDFRFPCRCRRVVPSEKGSELKAIFFQSPIWSSPMIIWLR